MIAANLSSGVALVLAPNTARAPIRLGNLAVTPTGEAQIGDVAVVAGTMRVCSVAGTPGTWNTIGSFNKFYSFSSAMVYGDSTQNTTGLVRSWIFTGAGVSQVYCSMQPPSTYAGGNITVKVVWAPAAAPIAGQAVKLFFDYYSLANGADIGTSPVTTLSLVHTFAAETIDDIITDTIGTITLPNANCYFRVRRDGGDAQDTWVSSARFHSLNLEFP
jgi:hypothetical protein